MTIIRLSGGVTPGDGADPRSFPAIFNAAADYIENGFRYAGTRYFFSDGTFSKADPLGTGDIGLRAIRVRLVGGGGGTGGTAATGVNEFAISRAGGGAAYAESFLLASALSSSETVTRGAGGAGGAAGNNSGSNGATSSFGSVVSAPGGDGGAGAAASPVGAGAVLTAGGGNPATAVGDIVVSGGRSIITPTPASTGLAWRAFGGQSFLSGAANPSPAATLTAEPGVVGNGPGGGASSAMAQASQSAQAGAAGANGIVIVDCFV
jgi:hypothetical protein